MSTSTRFILTHTKDASNVGAAARALKTMGFQDLVLVSPHHDSNVLVHKKAIGSASGALDILKNARVVDTLPEALEGTNIWCGTGMPVDMAHARPPQRYVEPRIYFNELLQAQNQQERMENMELQDPPTTSLHGGISFVFGNERFGMTPMDLELCHVILGIPTNPSFGSLNLASAVQLIAYDWRQALGGF